MKFYQLLFCILAITSTAVDAADLSAGIGAGPNFSQLDAVNDALKSSVGASAWLSSEWGDFHRADLAFDYFSLTGRTDYHAISVAYGLRLLPEWESKPFAMLGLGIGKANNFPFAVNTNQNTSHLFIRTGFDEIYRGKSFSIGLLADFLAIKLDGNAAKTAYLALPMLSFKFRFGGGHVAPAQPVRPEPAVIQAAAPVKVATVVDSDRDGIFDPQDECPGTPLKTKVNSIGCPTGAIVTKNLRIEFATDKSVVLPKYYDRIKEFAKFLAANTDVKVTIEGHTDSVGSRRHNIELSQARADAVRQRLIEQHRIRAARIKAIGYGPDRPEAKNNSDSGKQKNRRVLAIIEN